MAFIRYVRGEGLTLTFLSSILFKVGPNMDAARNAMRRRKKDMVGLHCLHVASSFDQSTICCLLGLGFKSSALPKGTVFVHSRPIMVMRFLS